MSIRINLALVIPVFGACSLFAQAPTSLAGKVFHETVYAVVVRSSWSKITELKADGSAVVIKSARGNALTLQAPYKFFLTEPTTEVTYRYEVTGKDTATLIFRDSRGENTYSLVFDSPDAGSISSGLYIPNGGTILNSSGLGFNAASAKFSLSELSNITVAPATNFSLRGSVGSGRSLIAGFIVP